MIKLLSLLLLWRHMVVACALVFHPNNNGKNPVSAVATTQRTLAPPKCNTPTNKQEEMKRRLFLTKALSTAIVSSVVVLSKPKTAHGVISSKFCAYGEGEGCADLAEGNPLIIELQRKSSANKEAIQQEAQNAFYMKNYPDWFTTVGKTLVKKPDGSFMVVNDEELANLKAQNKIGIEYARAMGGKVTDVTQKPILVLKE